MAPPLDNRRTNLRVVTQTENARNAGGAQSNSLTGVLGVTFEKARGRYRARLKTRFGPLRKTIEEATADRLAMEREAFGIQPRREAAFRAAGISS